jgi:hypothetical protein
MAYLHGSNGFSCVVVMWVVFLLLHRCSMTVGTDARVTSDWSCQFTRIETLRRVFV